MIERLGSGDWAEQLEALNTTRSLSVYHASNTVLLGLHSLVRAVLSVVDNLRSQLSKAAIMCLTDMFQYLRMNMDAEMDHIAVALAKKAGETSGFIADEARRAMLVAIQNCTETRVISALLHANTHKNPTIRNKVASFIGWVVDQMGPRLCGTRELDRLYPVIVRFLSEPAAEPRIAGKKAILLIHEYTKATGEFDRLLKRCRDADVKIVDRLITAETSQNALSVTNANMQVTKNPKP